MQQINFSVRGLAFILCCLQNLNLITLFKKKLNYKNMKKFLVLGLGRIDRNVLESLISFDLLNKKYGFKLTSYIMQIKKTNDQNN